MISMGVRIRDSRWAEPLGVLAVLILSTAGSYAEAYPHHHYGGLHLRIHPDAVAFALVALPAVALLWRRTHPVVVYIVAVVGVAAWSALGEVFGAALVVIYVALYSLTVSGPRRTTLFGLGAVGVLIIWITGGLRGPWGWWGGPQLDIWGGMVATGAIGAYVAARRQWKESVRLQQEQAERAREEETRRRVDSERLRIARELHDVVAHSMAMINVQATAASFLLTDDPDQALEALQAIRRASKNGLRELRSILDVLRQVDGDSPSIPVPTKAALCALADATSAAGVPTKLDLEEIQPQLPPSIALATYRIVQESLTNVIRHASDASATVTIRHLSGRLHIEVINDGVRSNPPFNDGAGSGIVGMRERATALGGTLQAGPLPHGGFVVRAELPTETSPNESGTPPSDSESSSPAVRPSVTP